MSHVQRVMTIHTLLKRKVLDRFMLVNPKILQKTKTPQSPVLLEILRIASILHAYVRVQIA